MNNAIILVITVFCYAAQSVFQKKYQQGENETSQGNIYIFNLYMALSALFVFFLVSKGNINFHAPTAWFGLAFGVCYIVAFYFNMLAIKVGSLSLTALVFSYALIIPAVFGVAFLNETLKLTIVLGIGLLLLSLILISIRNEKVVITRKWSLYVGLAFLGNGGCSTIQKLHQVSYKGDYKAELMIFALTLVVIVFLIMFLLCQDKEKLKAMKKAVYFPVLAGICNAVVNLSVMTLSVDMPAVILFPVISGGGIVLTYFISRFLFKEQLSRLQKAGFLLGTLSVAVLNL